MEQYKLGEMEKRFADIIWEHAPLSSRALTELCGEALSWKRTTTYTMLKRLCDRKIFENQGGTV
ncbi:MAG: BlaI/MecI/CopY family transcriptional regulator, partial [Clostridia bacterium]